MPRNEQTRSTITTSSENDEGYELSNPIDLSLEAALELEELKQKIRLDAPALSAFFSILRKPAPPFEKGEGSICMLGDIRSYAMFRESMGQVQPKLSTGDFRQFRKEMERFLGDLEHGVALGSPEKIEQAKRFCLAVNSNMIARQMQEIYSRRERADSRYISHEFTP